MTDSENSTMQDISDEDIYKDFNDFNFESEEAKIETFKEQIKQDTNNLHEKVKELNEENKKLKKLNCVLEKNLSTLLKTAQAEIKRKDSVIQELRVQVDSFVFKRNSKNTRDKYSNTDDWQAVISNITGGQDCKCWREAKDFLKDDQLKKRRNREDEHRPSKNPDKSLKNLRYWNSENVTKRHQSYGNDSQRNIKDLFCKKDFHVKNKGESFIKHREKCQADQKTSRKSCREFSVNIEEDRQYSRRSGNHRYSSLEHEHKNRNSRDHSAEGRRRKGFKRSRSKSQTHNKEPSRKENHKNSRSSLKHTSRKQDSNQISKLINTDNCHFYSEKLEEDSNKPNENVCSKISHNMSNDLAKNPKETSGNFKRSSVLDTLYDEMITNIKGTSHDLDLSEGEFELEEGECDDQDLPNSEIIQEGEDWALSFKNERLGDVKPTTLYSKRMMKRLSLHSFHEETKNLNNEKINHEKVESEKEPGELTDDESIIEKSKEFKEVAHAALIESKVIGKSLKTNEILSKGNDLNIDKIKCSEKSSLVSDHVEISHADVDMTKLMKSNSPILDQEKLLLEKKIEGYKEVIEFSPFKNNYKLIKFSPAKPTDKVQNIKSISDVITQKEVETSIFTLLSSLSGIPVDTEISKDVEDVSELNGTTGTIQCQNTDVQESVKANEDTSENNEDMHNIEKRKSDLPSFKEKNPSEKVKLFDLTNKKEESVTQDTSHTDETTPGETTQFLNFFLLTTSPSKPILPAEQEKLIENQLKSTGCDLPQTVSEPDIDSQVTTLPEISQPVERLMHSSLSKMKKNKELSSKELLIKSFDNVCNERKTKLSKTEYKHDEKKLSTDVGKSKPKSTKNAKEEQVKSEKARKRKISTYDMSNITGGKKSKLCNKLKENGEVNFIEKNDKVDVSLFQRMTSEAKKRSEEQISNAMDFRISTTTTGVVHLQTPNKCVKKLKNLMISEQTMYQVLDKANPAYSPSIGDKLVEMTPRRMLKNDLMLTDSEDDSSAKHTQRKLGRSQSDNSECESDSGASDFVDLL